MSLRKFDNLIFYELLTIYNIYLKITNIWASHNKFYWPYSISFLPTPSGHYLCRALVKILSYQLLHTLWLPFMFHNSLNSDFVSLLFCCQSYYEFTSVTYHCFVGPVSCTNYPSFALNLFLPINTFRNLSWKTTPLPLLLMKFLCMR